MGDPSSCDGSPQSCARPGAASRLRSTRHSDVRAEERSEERTRCAGVAAWSLTSQRPGQAGDDRLAIGVVLCTRWALQKLKRRSPGESAFLLTSAFAPLELRRDSLRLSVSSLAGLPSR